MDKYENITNIIRYMQLTTNDGELGPYAFKRKTASCGAKTRANANSECSILNSNPVEEDFTRRVESVVIAVANKYWNIVYIMDNPRNPNSVGADGSIKQNPCNKEHMAINCKDEAIAKL